MSLLLDIERLSALYRNLLRKMAARESLQMVHIEILQYLSVCNRYSDTAQALVEYLGQTKGSISQSLGILEKRNLILRRQDANDFRIYHVSMSDKGLEVVRRIQESITMGEDSSVEVKQALATVLYTLQRSNHLKSFGICKTCRFHKPLGSGKFQCALTKQILDEEEGGRICREHEIPKAL
ncbi:MAG TPA: MarR family winged helix-turn-helix transcriptional regulator [Oligoflexus sp.]|uniref:MarR family winged helix-turn-helix transcriptional regulator n=1 Tax=Oligoflexus sp. TaxID=1971216 RepID=UPI002D4D2A2E|nr:MarR family winged helix-turn-helix transcriptional regulator [Oligoflexus sp.]HYX35710.1 MarR family winged helix-turn-helix transcriptional regulator [Oligoflexus sp.]